MMFNTKTNLGNVIDEFFNDPFLETDSSYIPTNLNIEREKAFKNSGIRSNILEDENVYMLEMQVPGLTKNDIYITAENGHLSITSKAEDKFKSSDLTYLRREFYNTELELDYRLPDNVDIDNIKAKVENGILGIVIRKLVKSNNNKKQIKIS